MLEGWLGRKLAAVDLNLWGPVAGAADDEVVDVFVEGIIQAACHADGYAGGAKVN